MRLHIIVLFLLGAAFASCEQSQAFEPSSAVPELGLSSLAGSPPATAATVTTNVIYKSADGGQSWQDISAGLPEDAGVRTVFAAGNDVLLGGESGLFRSAASGGTPHWQLENLLGQHIDGIFPGRSGLYAISYGNGIYQQLLGTGMWAPVFKGLKIKNIRSFLEMPDGSMFVGNDNGIYKSADQGQTWKQVFEGGIVLDIVAADQVLIAGNQQGVLRSTDGGEHWELAFDADILAKKTGRIGDRFITVLGTRNPGKVHPEGITSRLRTSADGGKTWQRLEQTLFPIAGTDGMDQQLAQTKDVYDIVQVGNFLVCSFDTGIYRSADGGKSWELVFPADRNKSFNFTVANGVIYAVPVGGC